MLRSPTVQGVAVFVLAIGGCASSQEADGPPAKPPIRAEGKPTTPPVPAAESPTARFWVRPGYRVTQVAAGLGNARFLEFGPDRTLYLSRPKSGDILALKRDGAAYKTAAVFAAGYPKVHGLCFADGWLWFAQPSAIRKARDRDGDGKADEVATVLSGGSLPQGGAHWQRSILVTNGSLYTSLGDSGNITDERNTDRQKIWRYDLDGSGKRLFASGIRNTEKLRLRPGTSEIWGADHGSDWFGKTVGDRQTRQPITDLNPPCEFNHYTEGGFYGHPFLVGNNLPRIEYQRRRDIVSLASRAIPPAWSFGAHWAPNGFTFYDGSLFPPDHKGDAFVAMHGSWNSSKRVGYRIERVLFDQHTGSPYGSLTIVRTVGTMGGVFARPVDVTQEPGGALLFSCDFTNAIYRIEPDSSARGK